MCSIAEFLPNISCSGPVRLRVLHPWSLAPAQKNVVTGRFARGKYLEPQCTRLQTVLPDPSVRWRSRVRPSHQSRALRRGFASASRIETSFPNLAFVTLLPAIQPHDLGVNVDARELPFGRDRSVNLEHATRCTFGSDRGVSLEHNKVRPWHAYSACSRPTR